MRYLRMAIAGIVVGVFLVAGSLKLIDPASFQEDFRNFGFPVWWVYVTGLIEVAGAALIALSKGKLRLVGAILLALTMAAASLLHLIHDPVMMAAPALILMALAGYVGFTTWVNAYAQTSAPPSAASASPR